MYADDTDCLELLCQGTTLGLKLREFVSRTGCADIDVCLQSFKSRRKLSYTWDEVVSRRPFLVLRPRSPYKL
jgi:hypothetical protein